MGKGCVRLLLSSSATLNQKLELSLSLRARLIQIFMDRTWTDSALIKGFPHTQSSEECPKRILSFVGYSHKSLQYDIPCRHIWFFGCVRNETQEADSYAASTKPAVQSRDCCSVWMCAEERGRETARGFSRLCLHTAALSTKVKAKVRTVYLLSKLITVSVLSSKW